MSFISYIITTCCGDPRVQDQSTPDREKTMNDRVDFLIDDILPAAQWADQVIVAGRCDPVVKWEWPSFDYIEIPPLRRWRTEAGHIREIASRYAIGDILVYTPDDHKLDVQFTTILRTELALDKKWDVISPMRIHGKTGEELNNGHEKFAKSDGRPNPLEAYMGWHGNILRRHAWAQVPWDFQGVEVDYQDIPMTRAWIKAGLSLMWTDKLKIYDIEASADEN